MTKARAGEQLAKCAVLIAPLTHYFVYASVELKLQQVKVHTVVGQLGKKLYS